MNMHQQKNLNRSRRQQPQRCSNDGIDYPYVLRSKYDENFDSDQKEPNFGTKRSYTDKENQMTNFVSPDYQPQNISSKNRNLPKDTQKQQKGKKYAYIKNSNSLINSQKYDFEEDNSQEPNERQNYQILRKRQGQHQKYSTSQKVSNNKIPSNKKSVLLTFGSKYEQINFLRQSLDEERNKFEEFQQQTIKNQMKILETITNLEAKLKQVKAQNVSLIQSNQSLKAQIQRKEHCSVPKFRHNEPYCENNSFNPQINQMNEMTLEIDRLNKKLGKKQMQLKNLEHEYKKIKGVSRGLSDMMKKVDHIETPEAQDQVKYAWKWVKKVVWEYEAIRKKAYEWKKAYDELNKDSQNEQSLSSQEGY